MFLFSGLVTGPAFVSISLLVLELSQFFFMKDWPEIWKSEILPSESCPISEDWDKLGIPNLIRTSLILVNAEKCQGHRYYHFHPD